MTHVTPAPKKLLRDNGLTFWRSGRGDHEIWRHAETGRKLVVDHAIRSRHTANGILKQAGLPKTFCEAVVLASRPADQPNVPSFP